VNHPPEPRDEVSSGRDPGATPAHTPTGRAADYARFILRSPLRHRRLALAAVLLATALGGAALLVVPIRWEVRASILAQPGSLIGALSVPGAGGDRDAPARAVREVLTRRSNVIAISQRTRFVERYLAARAPAVRARDWIVSTLTGRSRSPDQVLEALADTLQDRLSVSPGPDGTIAIAFAWADRELAFDIVAAAVETFMEDRYATELKMAGETLSILEEHDQRIGKELAAAIQRLEERARMIRGQRAPPLAPALRARTARDEEVARLEVLLGARRRAQSDLEALRLRRIGELELQLKHELSAYAPDHPFLARTRLALEGATGVSPQGQALSLEVRDLEREIIRRGGRIDGRAGSASQNSLELVERLRLEARDPRLETERHQVEHLLREHARLLERIAAARLRLDVAPPAFKYRYSVVTPAQRPREPMRPYALLFLGGGLAGGLALAFFLSLAADMSAGRAQGRWGGGQELDLRVRSRAPEAPPPRARRAPPRPGAVALLLGVSLATAAVIVAGGGPLLAVLPAALVGGAWLVVQVPLRWSVAIMIFLLLGVDDTGEIEGQWRTPIAILGDLMQQRLDLVTGIPGLAVTGMEVVAVFLLAIWAQRRAVGSALDAGERIRTPAILRGLLLVTAGAVLVAEVVGFLNGQSLVPWKVRNLLHPVLLFLLFDAAFRGPIDHRLIGRVLVAAGVARAVLAVIVQRIAIAQTGGKYLTATSHGDSVLFAIALYLLVADLTERADGRRLARAALLAPVLLVGMVENGRRLVWVMVGMMLLTTYLISPMRGWKRRLTRAGLVASPLLALYVGVGWNSEARVFAPLKTLRGVSDTSYDHSAYWREVENWNIAMSMRERPVLGQGLGGHYTEHMANDDISSAYKEYREWPHNTVLGQLLLLGLLGFTAVWWLPAGALFLAFRSHRVAAAPEHRVAALGSAGALVACYMLAYGDTGAHYTQYKVVLALALAVAGKLAVAAGAWPARRGAV
jgi:uncharacterized protein involved in exopolysaccharide biosynthesis